MLGGKFYFVFVAAFEREQRDAADGRIFQLLAEFNFLFVKTVEVVAARVLDCRMKRRERLDKNFRSEQRDAADGRIFQLLAEFNFLFVKTVEVVAARVLDCRMKRRERLDKNF